MNFNSSEVNNSETRGNGSHVPLAIVGFSFEFPREATSVGSFWEMICKGRTASSDFPSDRMNIQEYYHPDDNRTSTIPLRGGNFLEEDLGVFDAPFFSITPAEAACMDPQHRKMLETAYHALEDAGITLHKCSGSDTSVYTGCFTNDYLSILEKDFEAEQKHAAMGVTPSMLANRLSWFFNFKGTSMNLDSACSSSLIALHLACQDLRSGTSSMALVGGANLVYHPDFMKMMSNGNFLSPDSQSWSFDDRANGYSRGEGIAVIVVKRLSDALRDGDTIRTIIRQTATNQDGRTPGITLPSQQSQIELIERSYKDANLDMEPTRFFEAHGTGTKAGDPVEANAIGKAFRHCRSKEDPLYIGAVKSNIGHLEGCSGLAGVIKALLVLERGIIPPIATFQSVNKQIDTESLHIRFPQTQLQWPTSTLRRACVNSFGFGGTNALVILDDVYHYLSANGLHGCHQTLELTPTTLGVVRGEVNGHKRIDYSHESVNACDHLTALPPRNGDGSGSNTAKVFHSPPKLVVWSAFEEKCAQRMSDLYSNFIREEQPCIDDLAHIQAVRRNHFQWRSFIVTRQYDCTKFEALEPMKPIKPIRANKDQRIAFIFTGQGTQYLGMGRELISFQTFKDSLRDSDRCLNSLGCPWSIQEKIEESHLIFPIDNPEYSQPLTTCLQIALVDLLKSFGIIPSSVIGHSSGEIAAAYAAGALSRSSAVRVSYYRGIVSSKLATLRKDMGMMAVGLSKSAVLAYLDRFREAEGSVNVNIACINSPKSTTLSGDSTQLTALCQWLTKDSIFARKLRVSVAYHSEYMKTISSEYYDVLGPLEKGRNSKFIPMLSTVTKDIVTTESLRDPIYWVQNMESPVNFEGAVSKLLGQSSQKQRKILGGENAGKNFGFTQIVEIGPHNTLQGPVRDIISNIKTQKAEPAYVPSLVRGQDASVTLLCAVGMLQSSGYPVNLVAVNNNEVTDRKCRMPSNMPKYPFNHQSSYWKEGRLSKNFRFPSFARDDLLGTRNLDWNPKMAQWRNVIRLSEVPWLEDHQVQGEILFPAAGMVVMAIEGLKQLVCQTAHLQGVQIKDIHFLHPIAFPGESDKVETQLNILTETSSISNSASWSYFRLFVIESDNYMECCSGYIRPVLDEKNRRYAMCGLSFLDGEPLAEWLSNTFDACRELADPYSVETTVKYGPCFQNLSNSYLGPKGEAMAEINTKSWTSKSASSFHQAYAVHPSTIDGLAQLMAPTIAKGYNVKQTMVPVHVSSIWIDFMGFESLEGAKIQGAARCKLRGYRGATGNIVATPIASSTPLIVLEGLDTSFITAANTSNIKHFQPRNLCTQLVWKPDIDMMSNQQIIHWCTINRPTGAIDELYKYERLNTIILLFILEALDIMDHASSPAVPHLEMYLEWMKYQRDRLSNDDRRATLELLQDRDRRNQLTVQVGNSGVEGVFFLQIGQVLSKVLRGEVDPLNVIFNDGLADRYYEEMLSNDYYTHPSSAFVELLCFKNPSMKILEVGAGTGGQTLPILKAMTSGKTKMWSRYDYTDISPAFFGQARVKFHEYIDQMEFRVCDISKDPASQSFETESYDLVIASHVLHATNDLDQTLRNIRKLLKPSGTLLLFETTRPEVLHIGFAFGLLKGWWSPLSLESRSQYSPCLTTEQWNNRLERAGFSGTEVAIPNQENLQCRYSSTIISKKAEPNVQQQPTSEDVEIAIVVDTQVPGQLDIARLLEAQYARCKIYTLAECAAADIPASALNLFLVELDAIFLDDISETDYWYLHRILNNSSKTLWITRSPSDCLEPRHHLVEGLGRTLASESFTRKFVTLSLDGKFDYEPSRIASLISNIMAKIINSTVVDLENNYMSKDGALQIGRVREYKSMNDKIARQTLPRHMKQLNLDTDTRISLDLETPGQLETLQWISNGNEPASKPLDQDEVLVEIRALGLTLRDYLLVSGQLNDSGIVAECAGVVLKAGDKSGLHPGDRVCVIGKSLGCSVLRLKTGAVAKMPEQMSFEEGAAMPTSLWLAYHGLVEIARVQKGESVLVIQASSSLGQMVLQIAKSLGAEPLAIANSASEKILLESFDLPETKVLRDDYSSISLKDSIYRATHGKGVDIILGPITEDLNVDYSDLIAPFGRLIDIGIKGEQRSLIKPYRHTITNSLQASIDMIDLLNKNPDLVYNSYRKATDFCFEQHLKPPQPLQIFQADEIEDAFRNFESSITTGKRIVQLRPGSVIQLADSMPKVNVEAKPEYQFPANATYVIAGGLGGLGRSSARWMVNRGARNMILLSRSGINGKKVAQALVSELEAQGACIVTPIVDVGDLNSLRRVLKQVSKDMPPIRGCIQATVALRDNLFENMSYEDWDISTRSKVTASWNLHKALPSDLDFFVLFSSINGIFGGRAQANYAAGNTFKDALAHYRVALGQKAVSIDLGMMVDEGVVAENESVLNFMRRIGHLMDIQEEELLGLLDYYCDPKLPLLFAGQAQILVGIEMPSAVLAKGIDLHHSIFRPMFRQLFRVVPESLNEKGQSQNGAIAILDREGLLRKATSLQDAITLVAEWFSGKIGQILGLAVSEIDTSKPIHTYGIDSLIAIDLKNWLAKEIGADIAVFMLLGNTSIESLSRMAAEKSRYRV
ncbi:hypothetical protein BGAL_0004g00460 [Botrytis galanthina]|uniref:Uncharacterized protein n=1 Tax=Botrytis galanthina TaxID=278940 RepID=A0A4S8RLK2_9HELO|nr:hypothetical protein BGAL_0004g00460 [Botrytis galanthina]